MLIDSRQGKVHAWADDQGRFARKKKESTVRTAERPKMHTPVTTTPYLHEVLFFLCSSMHIESRFFIWLVNTADQKNQLDDVLTAAAV